MSLFGFSTLSLILDLLLVLLLSLILYHLLRLKKVLLSLDRTGNAVFVMDHAHVSFGDFQDLLLVHFHIRIQEVRIILHWVRNGPNGPKWAQICSLFETVRGKWPPTEYAGNQECYENDHCNEGEYDQYPSEWIKLVQGNCDDQNGQKDF